MAPESTHRFPGVGTIGEQDIVLFGVLCGRTTIELCLGCEKAKGCVGEFEEDLFHEHNSHEASALTGVEQPTTT